MVNSRLVRRLETRLENGILILFGIVHSDLVGVSKELSLFSFGYFLFELLLVHSQEWEVASSFLVHHEQEDGHDHDPVKVVGQYRAVSGRVLPAKQGIENHPTVVSLGVAAVDVPDTGRDFVGARATAGFSNITARLFGEDVHFKVPDGTREEAGTDEVDEAGGGNQENLDGHEVTTAIDNVTDEGTSEYTANDGDGKGGCRSTQGDTTDEDDGFQTFTKSCDERQDGDGIFFGPSSRVEFLVPSQLGPLSVRLDQSLCDLDSPLFSHFVNTKHSDTHDSNHDGSDHGKDTFP